MGATDKFCLRWNDFESNISLAFRELRHESDFFDVTLACEDDRQIQAHKLILSACSPFFKHVLRTNPHAQPLLYLKGVRYADMLAVLNFMYHGEVNVSQDELNSFLAVAEELNVKGLTTGATATDASAPTSTSTPGAKNHHKRSATATSHGGPAKRGRKSAATLAAQAAQEQAAAAQPKDEALEGGIRVKDEPRPGHSAAEDNFGDSFGQDGGGAAAADDDGGYDNYEGFGDGAGDYGDEGQLMDPNVSLGANSGDGSKASSFLDFDDDGAACLGGEANYEVVKTKFNSLMWVSGAYCYIKNNERTGRLYLKCRRANKCKARAILLSANNRFVLTKPHTCPDAVERGEAVEAPPHKPRQQQQQKLQQSQEETTTVYVDPE